MRAVRIIETPQDLSRAVAEDIAGRRPKPVHAALAARGLDLSRLVIVMMDDYLTEVGGVLDHVDGRAHCSCRRFAREDIQAVLNAGLPFAQRIPDENVWYPDPQSPATYDARIGAAGGIDYFLLASGASDGHVAFNPAGSAADSVTRVVTLAEETRRDNLMTFPDFAGLEAVPRHGVTVGIATIAAARACAMVVWGADKRLAFQRLSAAPRYRSRSRAARWAAQTILAASATAARHRIRCRTTPQTL